jgi:DNA repair protein RadC
LPSGKDPAIATPHPEGPPGYRGRLRQRFLAEGGAALHDLELIELLLSYGCDRPLARPLARRLLDTFGSAAGVLDAPHAALEKVDGMTPAALALIRLVNELGAESHRPGRPTRAVDGRQDAEES